MKRREILYPGEAAAASHGNAHNDDWTAHARHSIHSANLSSDKREPNMTDTPEYTPPEVWVWDKDDSPKWRYGNVNRPIAGATHEKELARGKHPLQLYSLATPNGVKVTIMLEELLAAGHSGAEYDAWLIRIGEGDQFGSGFVGVNPNSKIPALVDYSEETPRRVFGAGLCAALGAWLRPQFDQVDRARVLLEGSRFFEAAVASLLHVRLPGWQTW